MHIFRSLMQIIPRNSRERFLNLVSSMNPKDPETFAGILFITTIFVSILFATLLTVFFDWNFFLTVIGLFVAIASSIYMYLIVASDMKIKLIEELLPDALQLMASNLRAGISIE